jgi:hypothetical protein
MCTDFTDHTSALEREQIVGTPDAHPSLARKPLDTGAKAKHVVEGMRHHAVEATGGQTYTQMGRYLDKAGKPTTTRRPPRSSQSPASRSSTAPARSGELTPAVAVSS